MGDEPFDQQAFDDWLADDPLHQPAFDSMWRRTMGPDMDAALLSYQSPKPPRRVILACGLAVVLVAIGGYKAMPLMELYLVTPREYASPHDDIREVVLEDGTRLTLAGGATVKVRYTPHDRVVELASGTIFADVAHNQHRPFRIDAGDGRIVVVGTSFEVSHKLTNIRVAVASGIVQFGRNSWFSKPIKLNADQAAILDPTGLSRIENINSGTVARWRSEWTEYKGAPLRQVITDLQSLSPLPIRIDDDTLANKPVSGRIQLTDPVGQLHNLSITHNFHIRKTDDALILSEN